jgi:hypothetical protein
MNKMNTSKLFEYIKKNKEELKKLGITINTHDTSYGDDYYREEGESLMFKLLGKSYEVGYVYITEDDDDWAQAECYSCDICREDEKNCDPVKVYEILINYKSEIRNNILNKLI